MTGFDRWVRFVENAAKKIGKVFICESFEGNEMPDPPDNLEVQDLSGFLARSEDLKTVRLNDLDDVLELHHDDRFQFVFANWKLENGELKVDFEAT